MTVDMQTIDHLTSRELVGLFNGLAEPEHQIKAWKGKKSVLVARIEVARRGVLDAEASSVAAEVAEVDDAAETETGGASDKRTIRAAAIELLCTVVYHEDRALKGGPDNTVSKNTAGARSVGLPYDEIIRRIVEEFPDCQTSVACLRWYAVKIRVEEFGYEGLRLPQRRPRVKPAQKAA